MKKFLPFAIGFALLSSFPTAASAVPAAKIGTSSVAGQLALDGEVLYATDGRVVSRINTADGTSRTILIASRGYAVDYVVAGGGVAGIQLSKTAKRRQVATRALAFTDGTASTRVLATGTVSAKRKFQCGTEVAVTDVTETGEAITAVNKFSFSRKRCRKPVNSSAIVRGHSAGGVRVLYSGRANTSRSFASLGGWVANAQLAGSKLTLSAAGVGVFDIASQQFVLVRPVSRKLYRSGSSDINANTLLVDVSLNGKQAAWEIVDANSGYTTGAKLETTTQPVGYAACGKYLLRVQYARKRGSANSLTVVANPLIPAAAPNPDQLIPAGEFLLHASCDANSVAFSSIGASTSTANVWRAPLSG